MVVGRSNSASSREAFLWGALNGMRELDEVLVTDFGLDLTGWTLQAATGVSDDGLVVSGYGLNPDGNIEAFIANMRQDAVVAVPAPGIIVISALGLAGLGYARRRRAA